MATLMGKIGAQGKVLAALLAMLALALLAACSESAVLAPPTEEFGGPEFAGVVVNSDLGVGQERLAFGVLQRDGPPLMGKQATVHTYYLPPDTDAREQRQTLTAEFEEWPLLGGVFVAEPTLDTAGIWELEASFTSNEGVSVSATAAFQVRETSATPLLGDMAPASVTARTSDVPDLSHITTDPHPDPSLYSLSIHEALETGTPLVVLFATPAYCQTATCGPLVEDMSKLKSELGESANFIHVEVYRDPHLIEPGQRPGRDDTVTAIEEWGLPTEPWTFVVDGQGVIRAKFESYVPPSTIRASLEEVLN